MLKEKSVGAVIFRKEGGKIYYLLLHYGKAYWGFAKGRVEKGETEKETALREIKEETGIDKIKFIEGFQEHIKYFFRRKSQGSKKSYLVSKDVIFYLAETSIKNVKISFEHIGFVWLTYKDAIEHMKFKNSKSILVKANEFLVSQT
jgi:8-oxo-dGTP pyrophosphatase MutT (NUDIX family)